MIEDIALLRAYAGEKSESAFAELVQRRVGLVYTVALRQVGGDTHLAEDVTQKVFTELARHARSLVNRPALGGWLYRVAHSTAIDLVRSERRRRAREPHGPLMQDASDNPHAAANWDRLRPMLDEALSTLGDSDRDAVALRFFEGRSFADTGRALKLSEEAARKRIDRALDKMAGTLTRRGVTSTSAALSLALAEQAALAAPSGLAATVTGTALAGAGVATGWSFLNFLTSAKLSLSLGAAAAVAIGVAAHEWNQAQEQAARLESLQRDHEILRVTAEATTQRLALAEQRARAADDDSAILLTAIAGARRIQTAAAPARLPSAAPRTNEIYEEKNDPAAMGSQLHLRMIQLSRKPGDTDASLSNQANLILARFRNGENFANLAKEFSNDKRSEKGGDWGWQKPGDLRAIARDSAFNLNKGEASAPLLLPEGCFILYAEDRK